MRIVVTVKQVPEMERVKFDAERGLIDRQSAGVEINPFDLNALETAVRLKEEYGASVVALSMGPPRAEEVLREALSRGADEGILLTDRRFGGSDTFATSATLAAAVRKTGDFDLIVSGEMTVDGDTAQVGPQLAEFLGIPHVSYVSGIVAVDPEYGYIEVAADAWAASWKKRLFFPALITVTKDINSPRLAGFKDKMAARKAEIPRWGAEEIEEQLLEMGLDGEQLGIKGSPTQVRKIIVPPAIQREGRIFREDPDAGLSAVLSLCREKRLAGGGE